MGPPSTTGSAAESQHIVTPSVTPTPEEVSAQLDKLDQSRLFARSGRMRRFLRFAVEHALAGTGDQIKEYSVGVEVFDRKQDYDPRTDPIVRVEARRLREKLRLYYKSDGQNDSVVIELPKGAYMPVFGSRAASSIAAPAGNAPTAIAVLPFANLSPEAGDDYFSDGLTEELILLLTRVKELRVVAWYSASQFRGREQDLRAIREELNVGVVLRGSVRRSDARVRVMAQLIDTGSGAYLWSEAFDRGARDVLAIQEEIARAIVGTLRLALDFAGVRVTAARKLNVESYNLCLQARFHARGRTRAGLRKSLECYQQAIEKDPASPSAHAGLADTYSLLADYGVMHPKDAMPQAEAAAQTALELDPNSAEASSSLAYIRSLFNWKWQEAEALYRRAITLNPGSSRARHWFSIDFLALLGRFDEAEPEIQRARELDPLSVIIHEGSPYLRNLRGDYEGALREFQQIMDLDSSFYKAYSGMARTFSLMGRYDEAIVMFHEALRIAGDVPNITGALGQTLALAGRREEALHCLDELHSTARTRYVPSTCFAIVHIGLGELDKSLDWLEAACDQRELPVTMVKVHPVYDPLRSQARFKNILARLGLTVSNALHYV
jgi:TolB-like protein/Tfp pilus assembly protein PilF